MSEPAQPWSVTEVADLRGDRLILVSGELDIATAPQLAELLSRMRERRHSVVLDLSEVGFVDSSGLNVLLDARDLSRRDDWSFTIRGASARILRIARLAGADDLLS